MGAVDSVTSFLSDVGIETAPARTYAARRLTLSRVPRGADVREVSRPSVRDRSSFSEDFLEQRKASA